MPLLRRQPGAVGRYLSCRDKGPWAEVMHTGTVVLYYPGVMWNRQLVGGYGPVRTCSTAAAVLTEAP